MPLATLSVDIVAKLAKLDENMSAAARISEKNAARIQRAMDDIKSSALTVGGSLAGLFTVTEVAAFLRSTVDAVDALNDVKDATGSTIEKISGLEDVALRTGGSLDDVSAILVKFNAVLKEADGKNGASQALKAIGLDAEELKRLDPADALQRLAVALSQYADDGNKARIVQEFLGKSIRDAAPFLNDLAEAGQLNATVTAEQAQQAERLNKEFFQLRATVQEFTRDLVSDAIPVLNDFLTKLKNGGVSEALGVDMMRERSAQLAAEAEVIEKAGSLALLKANVLRQVMSPEGYKQDLARLTAELGEAQARMKAAQANYYKLTDKFGAGRGLLAPELPRPSVGDLPGKPEKPAREAKEKQTEADRYLESLQKQLQGLKDLTAQEKVLDDITSGRLKGLNAHQAGLIFDQAALIDQVKQKDAAFDSLFDDLERGRQAAKSSYEEAQRYLEASLTPAEKLAAELKKINDLYQQGGFGTVGTADAMAKVNKVIDDARAKSEKLTDGAKEMADALKEAVFQGKDLGKALEAIAMKRFIFEPVSKAVDALFTKLASAYNTSSSTSAPAGSSGGGGSSDMYGSLFKVVASYFGGFFADGGYLEPGKWGIAGEQGPEPIFGGRTGLSIVPNGAAKAAGAATTIVQVTQHIGSIGSNVSHADIASAMSAANARVKGEILYSMRTRGVFSNS